MFLVYLHVALLLIVCALPRPRKEGKVKQYIRRPCTYIRESFKTVAALYQSAPPSIGRAVSLRLIGVSVIA